MQQLPNRRETEIWVAMNRHTRLVHARVNAALKAAGLPSLKWYDVLWTIERRGGQLRPSEVEEEVVFEQSSLSHLGRRMMAEGLLQVVPCEGDGRGKLLQVTEKGRAVRAQMWQIYGPLMHEMMAPLAEPGGLERFIDDNELPWSED
jgi:DNA-binding MarR family transcriptional regulator